jgi:hypothetical protein
MNLVEAIKTVVESRGALVMGSTQIRGDVIVWDNLEGWIWQKSGLHPHFLHPQIMLGNWIIGEKR